MSHRVPQDLLERHNAFWDKTAGVLLEEVGVYRPLEDRGGGYIPLADGTRAVEGQRLTPESIDPALFYGAESAPRGPLSGQFLSGAAPPHLCWSEAAVGCPVRIVRGGPWAEPFAADWRQPETVVADERWLSRLEQFTRLLVARADGRAPVVQPLMRGPADMMAAALGHEAACLAMLDEPAAADAFLARCAAIFLETAQRRLRLTPPFAGGYLSSYGIWAPGTTVRTQIDNATMLSPGLYRDLVLPHDRSIMESFDFALIHLHSGCLHVVDALLEVEALRAVQVSIDHPGGPLAAAVMPILRHIAAHKPLIVTGPVTTTELAALRELRTLGSVCLRVAVSDGHITD